MTRSEFIQAFVVQHASLERALKFVAMLEASEEAPWDDETTDDDADLEVLLNAVELVLADAAQAANRSGDATGYTVTTEHLEQLKAAHAPFEVEEEPDDA